jgi:hypothetical protein
MFKIGIFALLLIIQTSAYSQRNHFIAIQSENKEAFYARVQEKKTNSSATGHIIIPKLADSTYLIIIGFSQNAISEQRFSITVNKDVGFILKNLKEKGWALSNSQTGQLTMAAKEEVVINKSPSEETVKKDNNFSKLMAQVVNDSAVMENITVEEEPKKEIIKTETAAKSAPIVDSSLVVKNKKQDEPPKKPNIIKTPEKKNALTSSAPKKSIVKKLLEQKNDSSLQLMYEDDVKDGVRDTINVIIPFDSTIAITKPAPIVNGIKDTGLIADKKKEVKENIPGNAIVKDSSNVEVAKVQPSDKQPLFRTPTANTNCKNTASDHDVDQLRVKMLAIDDEDDKITVAKKMFKAKCFSTNQIKALSEVFPKDAGKYKLFDAAYSFVSDAGNFVQLQSLLKDEYYISRFKAMIR